ncbi:unnamed protein product [Clonostachys solani]|uniref:Uncharacterized protein n=1 Tax=Clonostachys solani TaxID=160281 RepID=A0A9N9ZDN6_9HYPO|nr:unnamed protein product [Clonostachys solani]
MASSPQSAQPIFLRQVVDATDEELTELILHHPWYIASQKSSSMTPRFELEPGESPPSSEEEENLHERLRPRHEHARPRHDMTPLPSKSNMRRRLTCLFYRRLREKALAPPYPITKERLELAALWRRVRKSIPSKPPVEPPVSDPGYITHKPSIGPPRYRDYFARRREKEAYILLLELGGRPVYPLDRLFNGDTNNDDTNNDDTNSDDTNNDDSFDIRVQTRTEKKLQPWKLLYEHLAPEPEHLRGWESSVLQLKNWERFLTWQRDHRGPNDQDNFQAFAQEQYRDWEIVQRDDGYSTWCLETEEQPTRLWSAWEKRQHDRATYREQGCGSFTDYSEAVRRRLEKNGFRHPFQLHPDPMQQDPLTTWIEYLAYEYWWLDHYTEALESTQETLLEVWEGVDSHELFERDEALVEEKRSNWMKGFRSEWVTFKLDDSVLTYSPVCYFTTTTKLPQSKLDNELLWAKEVFDDAKSLSDMARAQAEREREGERADYYKKASAASKLDQLREDCDNAMEKAKEGLKRSHARRKYHRRLLDLTKKTSEQVMPRHWQRKIVEWALDEFRLVEEEVLKLPGSSDIPMIAAKGARKRVRFTSAEPSVRLLPTIVDAAESSDPGSDKERKAKRRRLALDAHPSSSDDQPRPSTSSVASRLERVPGIERDASPAATDGVSDDEQEGVDERPIITGESSGQDNHDWASERDVSPAATDGDSDDEQDGEDERPIITGESRESSGQDDHDWASERDVSSAATDGDSDDEQDGEDERPIITGGSSGQDDHGSTSERDVLGPKNDGSSNVQQEEDDDRQSATGESNGQGAPADASSSSPRSPRSPEYQAALSPVQPGANEDHQTDGQCTSPASGDGDGQDLPQGAGSEPPVVTAEGKGKAKRPLPAPAALDADESRPKRRRTHTAKQANTAHGTTAGQGTPPSDGPGQDVPQEEGTIQDCVTVSPSSLAKGPLAARGSRQAKPRKRGNGRKRKA